MKYYDEFLALKSFHFSDAVEIIGNEATAKSLLRQYCKKGYIAPIKKGLYVAMNIVDKEPILNKFQIASRLTATSVVSYHSAFEYYGYVNQVYNIMSVMSVQKFNSFDFNGCNYRRFAPRIASGVIEDTNGVRVTDIERTIIDSIDAFEMQMGLEELLSCISSIAAVNEQKLIRYLNEYGKCFLYQKAGFILEHFQNDLMISDIFFETCREKSGKSSRYLVKNILKSNMGFSAKWHLVYPKNLWVTLMNEGVEYADI